LSAEDNPKSIGSLDRQEVLTYLMIFVFGGFAVIVAIIMYLVLSSPDVLKTVVIDGTINIGLFIERFDELLIAFLILLGVGVGAKIKK